MRLLLAHLSDSNNALGDGYSNIHRLEGACSLKQQGTLG
jgi:hypothetical protein